MFGFKIVKASVLHDLTEELEGLNTQIASLDQLNKFQECRIKELVEKIVKLEAEAKKEQEPVNVTPVTEPAETEKTEKTNTKPRRVRRKPAAKKEA